MPRDGITQGEIVARGNVIMAGYYNDPDATEQALREGWLRTGDAAVVHPDGYVEIRDRLKDVIISRGENISSVEVEGVLLRHPAVQEVAIVGLPHERWGEAPHAFVVLRQGARADESELREFARANVAHFKAPHGVTFIKELPKTATGKIQNTSCARDRVRSPCSESTLRLLSMCSIARHASLIASLRPDLLVPRSRHVVAFSEDRSRGEGGYRKAVNRPF